MRIRARDLPDALRRIGDRVVERGRRGLVRAAYRSHRRVLMITDRVRQPHGTTLNDRGFYRRAWSVIPTRDGARLINTSPHAAIVEHGSRPHWAPRAPVRDWVVRKLMVGMTAARSWNTLERRARTSRAARQQAQIAQAITTVILRNIARRGTKGRGVLTEAWPDIQRFVRKAITEEMNR